MAGTCVHAHTIDVGDMPMADPGTYAFLGRFDVVFCTDCLTVISQVPAVEAPPLVTP